MRWLLPVVAQQPPAAMTPPTVRKQICAISTTTQLVVEDVLIKGKDGKPILGLKPSDFTITEDGKPQKISIFEFQTLEEAPSLAVRACQACCCDRPARRGKIRRRSRSPPSRSRPKSPATSNTATAG